jgi:phytoene synthase
MQHSQSITRKSASNLALAFILLPKARREAMAGLYAFCREVDDIADEDARPVAERRAHLAEWRADLHRAYGNESPRLPVLRELQPVIHAYRLDCRHFEALLDGVEMDLNITRYETQEDLELYCYRVASVVGLLSIEIFGYRNPQCRDYAVFLGKALQLTNILRDVAVDAQRSRIYLPQAELTRFAVREADILAGHYTEGYRALAASVGQRARWFYGQARQALPPEDRRSMIAAELMGSVYWCLLEKLEDRAWNIFGPLPTRLSKLQKIMLMGRTWLRITLGVATPNYGQR